MKDDTNERQRPNRKPANLDRQRAYSAREIMLRTGFRLVLLASCLFGGLSCAPTPSPMLPENLQWVDSQVLPGAKNATLVGNPAQPGFSMWRSSYPANYRVPPHYHSVTEYVTVISGTVYNAAGERMDTSQGKAYPAGSFFINPANHPHYFWTTDHGAVLQFSIIGPLGMTFVNPADDPRRK
jgi:quercetin dioxygenase-like cupin family protein